MTKTSKTTHPKPRLFKRLFQLIGPFATGAFFIMPILFLVVFYIGMPSYRALRAKNVFMDDQNGNNRIMLSALFDGSKAYINNVSGKGGMSLLVSHNGHVMVTMDSPDTNSLLIITTAHKDYRPRIRMADPKLGMAWEVLIGEDGQPVVTYATSEDSPPSPPPTP